MNRIGLTLAVAMIVVFISGSCHKSQPPEPNLFRISGTVVDSLTGSPIDSARVINVENGSDEESDTDESGYYEVPAVEGLKALVRVTKAGYKTKEREFQSIRTNMIDVGFELVPDSLDRSY